MDKQKRFLRQRLLPVFILFTLCLPAITAADGRAENCLAGGCHTEIRDRKVVHAPADGGDCLSCHRQEKQTHPSGSGPDFSATAEGGPLCFQCHEQGGFSGRHLHGPSASGNCTACHDPHGSSEANLLKMPLKELCLDCHQDFAENMEQATHLHTAIRKLDCGACHLPHGSDSPSLLKGDSIELCFGCHDNIRGKYDSSLTKHKALYIRQRCGNCHFAHFSQYPALLVREGADLCYTCHGQDDPGRSDALPNIRVEIESKEHVHGPVADGECAACHDPHGRGNSDEYFNGIADSTYPSMLVEKEEKLCFKCHSNSEWET
ncbi:MAG: hypothetical protein HY789_03995, partial [Deltaproteobacteria bacterium]|nr:hypothetical protein [Deltaproteobacteria bacterium]